MTAGPHPGLILRSHTGGTYLFDPGALCLELLLTGGPGPYRVYEVLHEPGDVAAWAARSRLTPTPELEITAAELTTARHFRDALFAVVRAHTRGEPPDSADLETVNQTAARPPLVPTVTADGARGWQEPGTGTQLLSTLARDAIELLTGPYAQRIRVCAAADCQLMYVDTSRPGRRRWCSMEHCGNRHKVRAHRSRHTEKEG
ncbi:CGNR zinc finger domain-containing protein [Nocardia sp. X0981]